jgi:Domain of unknown function (DUF4260)
MLSKPGVLLRLEGVVVMAFSVFLYWQAHAGWLLFALLFLAPDLSMLGYLRSPRLGAAAYNAMHTLTAPLLLLVYAVAAKRLLPVPYALVWTAHIGMDRLLGFGLKYPTCFKDTHLQRVVR